MEENLETETVDDVLSHYGVPGMKWGRRKSSGGTSVAAPSPKASGGKPAWQSPPAKAKAAMSQPVPKLSRKDIKKAKKQKDFSSDAKEFQVLKQKVKKKGLESLTNDDLKKVNQRMELQQKYKKSFPKKKNPLVTILTNDILLDIGLTKLTGSSNLKYKKFAVALAPALALKKALATK